MSTPSLRDQYDALIALACAHLPHDSPDIQKRAARAILAQGPSAEAVTLLQAQMGPDRLVSGPAPSV